MSRIKLILVPPFCFNLALVVVQSPSHQRQFHSLLYPWHRMYFNDNNKWEFMMRLKLTWALWPYEYASCIFDITLTRNAWMFEFFGRKNGRKCVQFCFNFIFVNFFVLPLFWRHNIIWLIMFQVFEEPIEINRFC